MTDDVSLYIIGNVKMKKSLDYYKNLDSCDNL